MDSEKRKERAKALLTACDKGDGAAAAELINPDFTFQFMQDTSGWSVDGAEVSTRLDHDTFLNHGVSAAETVTKDKRLNFSFERAVCEGDNVMILGQSDALSLKGEPYRNKYCWYLRFDGERISELREYCDTKLANDVLFD